MLCYNSLMAIEPKMSRAAALAEADRILQALITAGDLEIFRQAGGDPQRIAEAAMRARERLADKIQAGEA